MKPVLHLGISPCPNDTYIFDALVHGRVESPYDFSVHMADVEELNSLACEGRLEVTKLSLAVMARVLDRYQILNAGAALGRGCGPLLVARKGLAPSEYVNARIAVPGAMTTANLLLSLTGKFHGPRDVVVFDQVMPAVQSGKADIGLVIHEGRFTYAEKGLELIMDLGEWWEQSTGLPLPLGAIAVRRDLGPDAARAVDAVVRRSLEAAGRSPEKCLPYIRTHAQEMDEAVMRAHIKTFVNDFSLNLGEEGRRAIQILLEASAEEYETVLPDVPFFVEE